MNRLSILAVIVFAIPVLAVQTTTVTGTILNNDGTLYNGSLTIQGQTFFAAGGVPVLQMIKRMNVRNGALSVSLVPNDTSFPGNTSYLFSYETSGASFTCAIPASPSTIIFGPPYCSTAPPPVLVYLLSATPPLSYNGSTGVLSILSVPQIVTTVSLVAQGAGKTVILSASPTAGDYELLDYLTLTTPDGSASLFTYELDFADDSGPVSKVPQVNANGGSFSISGNQNGDNTPPTVIHAVSGTPITVTIAVGGTTTLRYAYHATLVKLQ